MWSTVRNRQQRKTEEVKPKKMAAAKDLQQPFQDLQRSNSVEFEFVHTLHDIAHVDDIFAGFPGGGIDFFSSLEVSFREGFVHSLDRKTDAAFSGIDLDNAGFDFITDLEVLYACVRTYKRFDSDPCI